MTEQTAPAADYMSIRTEVIVRCLDCDNVDCEHALEKAKAIGERLAQQRRLESEIIKHAKGWRQALLNSSRDLIKAVDALEDFESQHGIQK